jgi:hypothetical protein
VPGIAGPEGPRGPRGKPGPAGPAGAAAPVAAAPSSGGVSVATKEQACRDTYAGSRTQAQIDTYCVPGGALYGS